MDIEYDSDSSSVTCWRVPPFSGSGEETEFNTELLETDSEPDVPGAGWQMKGEAVGQRSVAVATWG